MLRADYVVVGSGLTGAVIARQLADRGREVCVVDRRAHLGGNVHDHLHTSGIRVHTYGPHYFRTSSERIWKFANRFGDFFKYEAALLALVDGELVPWPVVAAHVRRLAGETWTPAFRGEPTNFEEAALSMMPRVIYEKLVANYNEKQWGVPPHTLSAELCARFDVRHDDERRLKPKATFQGIPVDGYAAWMTKMLDGINVTTSFDYLERRDEIVAKRRLFFTGPIDAWFGFDLGRLVYRGQRREHRYLPDVERALPCGQVNNPQHENGPHIRTLEWKHMMEPAAARRLRGTVLTTEVPFTPDDPGDFEYPFPDAANDALYRRYRARADALHRVSICGRLGEYRYFDMDQAIGRAMQIAANSIDGSDT